MTREQFYLITFESTHHAMRMEKLLKEKELNIEMIPTPREISASCGLSIRFSPILFPTVMTLLDTVSLHFDLYEAKNVSEDGKIIFSKL